MASRRTKNGKPEMIHCEYCGEDYSSTYKHCPFCDEMGPADPETEGEETPRRPRGGKRLATNTRGGGYGGGPSPLKIVGTVISLGLIVAAVIIVISIIMPLVSKGKASPESPQPGESVLPVESPTGAPVEESAPPVESEDPIPADQTATGFTLDKSEFSFSDTYPDPVTIHVTFIPAGSTGTITWTSSDPNIVSVDENGKVSHGATRGTATVTATMAGGVSQSCTVYNQTTSGTASTGGSTSTALSLNHTDFTFDSLSNPSVQMRVNGTSSTPVWSIGNASVASISADGVVKPVGRGTTTITCTVDGQTLTCTVRCSF